MRLKWHLCLVLCLVCYVAAAPTDSCVVDAAPNPDPGPGQTPDPNPDPIPDPTPDPDPIPDPDPVPDPEPTAMLLHVSPANPRYFADATGRAVLLTGSHVWDNLIDMGEADPPPVFDYDAYLANLKAWNHNFFRLWTWELVNWDNENVLRNNEYVKVAPQRYARTGPGLALDGKPKFNLDVFDSDYFNRLRIRLVAAQSKGMYASIMLFEGWAQQFSANHLANHPFHPGNNINNTGAFLSPTADPTVIHTLEYPEIIQLQERYVRKVIDTVNDLDNVLYEISNESWGGSTAWQYHMINFVKDYEALKPKQHPVGMTFQYKGGTNQILFDSPADWISPNHLGGYRDNPPAADGSKVIITDTDHLWGIGGDQAWVWKSFMRGLNPLFMDPYNGNLIGEYFNPGRDPVRLSMGYARTLSRQVDLNKMLPRGDLVSTAYCLADVGDTYLVYLPAGGSVQVDLRDLSGDASVVWFNPNTNTSQNGAQVTGGASRTLTSPFGTQDAVLKIKKN